MRTKVGGMMESTRQRWTDFKAKRAEQYERDEKIKGVLRDVVGALEVIGLMAAAWFMLAVCYA